MEKLYIDTEKGSQHWNWKHNSTLNHVSSHSFKTVYLWESLQTHQKAHHELNETYFIQGYASQDL